MIYVFETSLCQKFDNSRKMTIFVIRRVFYEKTLSPLYNYIALPDIMHRILLRLQSAGDSRPCRIYNGGTSGLGIEHS